MEVNIFFPIWRMADVTLDTTPFINYHVIIVYQYHSEMLMSNIIRPNVLSYAFHTSKAVHTAYTTQNVKGSIFLLQRACTSMRLKEVCWAIVSGLIIYAVPRNLYSPTNPYQFN